MINYKRPSKPANFHSKQITRAIHYLGTKIRAGTPIKSKEFVDLWGAHKGVFSKSQGDGKCGYCETRVNAGSPGGVDHYRPKAEVVYLKKLPILANGKQRKRKQAGKISPGYWWLTYEWHNWIFSCDRCNNMWKKNQFPTNPAHIKITKNCESSEFRLLLNPFSDKKIGTNFSYDFSGNIKGITDRGKVTIEVCGLDRPELINEREMLADKLIDLISDIRLSLRGNNIELYRSALLRIYKSSVDNMPYAGMTRFIINERKDLIGFNWLTLQKLFCSGKIHSINFADRLYP